MKELIVTNNPLVNEKFNAVMDVEYREVDFLGILEVMRDKIHSGHKLLTHPLSSSLKPNETPYKSAILSAKSFGSVDFESLSIIESSIESTKKFQRDKKTPNWSPNCLEDFQVIDSSVIEQAVDMKKHM